MSQFGQMSPATSAAPASQGLRYWDLLVILFAVLAVLMTMSAFYYFYGGFAVGDMVEGPDPSPSAPLAKDNRLYQALWLLLLGSTAALLVHALLTRGVHASILYAAPIVVWSLLSAVWSVNSTNTLFYATMLAANLAIGYVLAEHLSPQRFLAIFGWVLAALVLGSLLLYLAAPDIASTARYGGSGLIGGRQMHGVFAHKADAGYYSAMLLVMLLIGVGPRLGRLARAFLVLAAIASVVLSNSSTALAASVVVVALAITLQNAGRWRNIAIIGVALSVIAFSFLVPMVGLGSVTEVLNRDAGLTGRVPIWASGLEFMGRKPWLGYGYQAFFDAGKYSPAWELWARLVYFRAPDFHNTSIDIGVSLGVIGLALYVLLLTRAFFVAFNRHIDMNVRVVLVALLTLLVFTATADFTLMKHNHFSTLLMAYCAFAAGRSHWRATR